VCVLIELIAWMLVSYIDFTDRRAWRDTSWKWGCSFIKDFEPIVSRFVLYLLSIVLVVSSFLFPIWRNFLSHFPSITIGLQGRGNIWGQWKWNLFHLLVADMYIDTLLTLVTNWPLFPHLIWKCSVRPGQWYLSVNSALYLDIFTLQHILS
jgi:hypothetical protein